MLEICSVLSQLLCNSITFGTSEKKGENQRNYSLLTTYVAITEIVYGFKQLHVSSIACSLFGSSELKVKNLTTV